MSALKGATLLLMGAAILVYCGVLERVLDRMRLRDRTALLLIGAMLLGTFLPPLRLGTVAVNIGGGVIPLGVCAYLLIRADTALERWRTLLGTGITAAAIYALTLLLPSEPEQLPVDPTLLSALLGGVAAWLLGRSRRGAFVCGVAGMLLADTVTALVNWRRGIAQTLTLGGGGLADAAVLSGMLSVLLCEGIGEAVERVKRRRMQQRGGVT
ncbi:MAG: DUF1614 domain-containing protein [Clostridia bacterium]|nr:DUF1614 domain-containing protein [Clostridia bacterium]